MDLYLDESEQQFEVHCLGLAVCCFATILGLVGFWSERDSEGVDDLMDVVGAVVCEEVDWVIAE